MSYIEYRVFLCHITTGSADYDASLMYVTLLATTNSTTTAELRIRIEDEDVLERDENFVVMLNSMEARIEITNTTSVFILNDDGELSFMQSICVLDKIHENYMSKVLYGPMLWKSRPIFASMGCSFLLAIKLQCCHFILIT